MLPHEQVLVGKHTEVIAKAFHVLEAGLPGDEPVVRTGCLASLLDAFLGWCKENRSPKTFKCYRDFLQSSARHVVGDHGHAAPERVTPAQVTDWLGRNPHWNGTSQRGAITALQRAFNWGVHNHGLGRNPIAGMEKPQARRRDDVITPDEFELLLGHVEDQAIRDLLVVSFDCGARPQEVKALEARHLDLAQQCAVLPTEEAKGKRQPRVILFPTARSTGVITWLAGAWTGPCSAIRSATPGPRWPSNAASPSWTACSDAG